MLSLLTITNEKNIPFLNLKEGYFDPITSYQIILKFNKRDKMKERIKKAIKQTFCMHRYAPVNIWGDYIDSRGECYWDKVCTKCGKVTQHYYLGENILRDEDVTHLKNIGVLQS